MRGRHGHTLVVNLVHSDWTRERGLRICLALVLAQS